MDCCRHDVPLSNRVFFGAQKHVVHLSEAVTHERLQVLLRTGRLCVSKNGKMAARLITNESCRTARLVIGDESIDEAIFRDSARMSGCAPRILGVIDNSALVWGKREGRRYAGLYDCSNTGIQTFLEGGEFIRTQSFDSGICVVVRKFGDPPHMHRLLIPSLELDLKIHERAIVTPLKEEEFLIVEPIGEILHRYIVGSDGFAEMFPIPLAKGERFVGLVRWRGNHLLAIRGYERSHLQSLGPYDPAVTDRIIPVEGSLERVWQSPSGQTLVYLSYIHRSTGNIHLLSVNGIVARIGSFTMDQNDLIWSPDGTVPAARIRAGMDGMGAQTLIAPFGDISIPQGLSVSEFLVDNDGKLAARIETDGEFDQPYVYEEPPHTSVTNAWNLHWSDRGEICYTCVLGEVVVAISDQTHLRR